MTANLPATARIVYKSAKGKKYAYLQLGGKYHPLKFDEKDPQFESQIDRILSVRHTTTPKNLDQLADEFHRSKQFAAFAKSTKKQWSPWITKIRAKLGRVSLQVFEAPCSIGLIETWQSDYAASKRNMDYAKQVLSRVLSYGVQRGLISEHHCDKIKAHYDTDRSDITWSEGEIELVMRKAPRHIGNVFELALFTGLRRGDLLALTWEDVKEHHIEVRTQKSRGKTLVEIPLYKGLSECLDKLKHNGERILVNSRRKPWTHDGFGASWRKVMIKLKIENKRFHDLRGTAATRLLKGGMERDDIVLLMGWSERHFDKVFRRYVSRKSQYAALKSKMHSAMDGLTGPYLTGEQE